MITRLALSDFRNHADTAITPGAGFVMLSGDNGAGKTNMLEAVSLFSPGRGMRRAPLREMARKGGPGNFSIAASLGEGVTLGTGTLAATPDRRQLRINGAAAPVSQLGEWLSVLWLTPSMDRLFTDSAGGRRRFLDRLVLALEPAHARHASRYEAAMRARNKLLAEQEAPDRQWLAALETGMAEHGEALAEARQRTVHALNEAIAAMPDGDFPRASLALDGWQGGDLARALAEGRGRDARAGRTLSGPHRQDLLVTHVAKQQPAAMGSTGEQKALLLGLVLAHADVVADLRGKAPILLLDEVAAHLDPGRRAALYTRLEGRGQTWMTATEGALFDGLEGSHYRIDGGTAATN